MRKVAFILVVKALFYFFGWWQANYDLILHLLSLLDMLSIGKKEKPCPHSFFECSV